MGVQWLSCRVLDSRPRAAGSSLTSVTALWSLSKTHLSWLSTGSTQETRPCLTERLLMGRKESNQTNKQCYQKNFSKCICIFFAVTVMGNVQKCFIYIHSFCTPLIYTVRFYFFVFLAYLSHWLIVSYCDRWMCVVRRQQLLQTTSPPKLLAGF